jgi:hypothetical protein
LFFPQHVSQCRLPLTLSGLLWLADKSYDPPVERSDIFWNVSGCKNPSFYVAKSSTQVLVVLGVSVGS